MQTTPSPSQPPPPQKKPCLCPCSHHPFPKLPAARCRLPPAPPGILHSIVCYFFPMLVFYTWGTVTKDGRQFGLYSFGVVVYTCCSLVVNLKLAIKVWCE